MYVYDAATFKINHFSYANSGYAFLRDFALPASDPVNDLESSEDGEFVFYVSQTAGVFIFRKVGSQQTYIETIASSSSPLVASASNDGQVIYLGTNDGRILTYRWNGSNFIEINGGSVVQQGTKIESVSYYQERSILMATDNDRYFKLYQVNADYTLSVTFTSSQAASVHNRAVLFEDSYSNLMLALTTVVGELIIGKYFMGGWAIHQMYNVLSGTSSADLAVSKSGRYIMVSSSSSDTEIYFNVNHTETVSQDSEGSSQGTSETEVTVDTSSIQSRLNEAKAGLETINGKVSTANTLVIVCISIVGAAAAVGLAAFCYASLKAKGNLQPTPKNEEAMKLNTKENPSNQTMVHQNEKKDIFYEFSDPKAEFAGEEVCRP